MANTFLFHDYEAWGADARRDRASQFAAIRTDENLNEIGKPIMIYSKIQEDTLPNPIACMITRITPDETREKGIPEYEFISQIKKEMSQYGTCSLGYNTINFDDEVTRNTLYRNLYDPYEREWANNCSRWDIIDVVRLAVAIYPDILKLGVKADGSKSYRLEDLSKANGIVHESAHDALSDVRATIGIAKIIKDKAPELFALLYDQRLKKNVLNEIETGKPLIIASSFFGGDSCYTDIVMPLVKSPENSNEFFCIKLSKELNEIKNLQNNDADFIKDLLYSKKEDLEEQDVQRPALHVIRANKCPIFISSDMLKALLPQEDKRQQFYKNINVNPAQLNENFKYIKQNKEELSNKLIRVYKKPDFEPINEVDLSIYSGGFASRNDKSTLQSFATDIKTRNIGAYLNGKFEDKKYEEMVFRLIGRNYPELFERMDPSYKEKWTQHCKDRLFHKVSDSVLLNFDDFFAQINTLRTDSKYSDPSYQKVLDELVIYGEDLFKKFSNDEKLDQKKNRSNKIKI